MKYKFNVMTEQLLKCVSNSPFKIWGNQTESRKNSQKEDMTKPLQIHCSNTDRPI